MICDNHNSLTYSFECPGPSSLQHTNSGRFQQLAAQISYKWDFADALGTAPEIIWGVKRPPCSSWCLTEVMTERTFSPWLAITSGISTYLIGITSARCFRERWRLFSKRNYAGGRRSVHFIECINFGATVHARGCHIAVFRSINIKRHYIYRSFIVAYQFGFPFTGRLQYFLERLRLRCVTLSLVICSHWGPSVGK